MVGDLVDSDLWWKLDVFVGEPAFIDAICKVDERHDEMSANCKKFYDSVDQAHIIEEILYEEV